MSEQELQELRSKMGLMTLILDRSSIINSIASPGIRCLYAAPNQETERDEAYHLGKAYAYLYSLHAILPDMVFMKVVHRRIVGGIKEYVYLRGMKGENQAEEDEITWAIEKDFWKEVLEDIEREYGKPLRTEIEKIVI